MSVCSIAFGVVFFNVAALRFDVRDGNQFRSVVAIAWARRWNVNVGAHCLPFPPFGERTEYVVQPADVTKRRKRKNELLFTRRRRENGRRNLGRWYYVRRS